MEGEAAGHLAGTGGSAFRLGVGPGGLARLRLGPAVTLLADARWRWLPDAAPRETWDLRAELRLHLTRALSLSAEARRTPAADEATLAVQAFY